MKHFSDDARQKEEIIEQLLLENYNQYYRLAYSYTHNEQDAADIVQSGAYRAIKNSASLQQSAMAQTWIYRIMLNETFRLFSSTKDNILPLEETTLSGSSQDTYTDLDLKNALDALDKKDKAVIILRFFEERKLEEIADILEENINTVKSRLYRSLKKLKLLLS